MFDTEFNRIYDRFFQSEDKERKVQIQFIWQDLNQIYVRDVTPSVICIIYACYYSRLAYTLGLVLHPGAHRPITPLYG